MRMFTQEELNRFMIYHMNDACEQYTNAKMCKSEYYQDYYFAQIIAFIDMSAVFADTDTYLELQKIARKALKIGDENI